MAYDHIKKIALLFLVLVSIVNSDATDPKDNNKMDSLERPNDGVDSTGFYQRGLGEEEEEEKEWREGEGNARISFGKTYVRK